jgi:hypothetical protein
MAQYLNFSTNVGPFVFKVLDTKFANFWLKHFLKIKDHYTLQPHLCGWPRVNPVDASTSKIIDQIVSVADEINSIEYITPLPEPVDKSLLEKLNLDTQMFLNRLHRYVVTATEERDRWLLDESPRFDWIPWENQEINHILNLLNQSIHQLEFFVVTPHRKKFNNFLSTIVVHPVASLYDDCVVYEDGVDNEISDSYMDDLRLYGHDVWIKKDILGKDFITAFADHDDHTRPDVRPPPMISGGIDIDIEDTREQFFYSSDFKDWLGQEPTNYHGSYPIGDIVERPDNMYGITDFKFDSIT